MKYLDYLLTKSEFRIYNILQKDIILDDKLLDDKTDELAQSYQRMDETGKEKLREVLEKFNDIYNTVNTADRHE